MISAKTDGTGKTIIEIDGRNLLLLGELVAVADCVSRTIFEGSEKDRVEFLKDLPDLVLMANPKFKATRSLFSPEQLKKMIEEGGK